MWGQWEYPRCRKKQSRIQPWVRYARLSLKNAQIIRDLNACATFLVADGRILKSPSTVIPNTLQQEILRQLQYQGADKCKKRSKEPVFWSNINCDSDQKMVKRCVQSHAAQLWHTLEWDFLEVKQYWLSVACRLLQQVIRGVSILHNRVSHLKSLFEKRGLPTSPFYGLPIASPGGKRLFRSITYWWPITASQFGLLASQRHVDV